MQLNHLQSKTPGRKQKRVARGGKRGKTAGRGTKGQKARAGHSIRPEIRDIIKKLPKLRGHGKNRARTVNDSRRKPAIVNLQALEQHFESGATISPESLLSKKLIARSGGKFPVIKLLGEGKLSKKFIVSGCVVSQGAKAALVAAGGEIV